MTTIVTQVSAPERATKLFPVGRIWINAQATGNQPPMSGQIDRDLGASITLSPNDRLLFFPNVKREGIRDADFRIAIELPTAIADSMIERRRGTVQA